MGGQTVKPLAVGADHHLVWALDGLVTRGAVLGLSRTAGSPSRSAAAQEYTVSAVAKSRVALSGCRLSTEGLV